MQKPSYDFIPAGGTRSYCFAIVILRIVKKAWEAKRSFLEFPYTKTAIRVWQRRHGGTDNVKRIDETLERSERRKPHQTEGGGVGIDAGVAASLPIGRHHGRRG